MRCGWCGRFISYSDMNAMTYTDYGNSFDLEPPEETYICGKCWKKMLGDKKEYYRQPANVWRIVTKLFRL